MTEIESMAEHTCHKLLNARQLKAICRFRGFSLPGGRKADLASFVAPRLLDPTGAAEAMASLEEPWSIVLHVIAMADGPLDLDDLQPVIQAGRGRRLYGYDHRDLFGKVAEGLLNRGVVLVEERQEWTTRRKSRFERLDFVFPAFAGHSPLRRATARCPSRLSAAISRCHQPPGR